MLNISHIFLPCIHVKVKPIQNKLVNSFKLKLVLKSTLNADDWECGRILALHT